jgi:hypothetical protein
VWALALLAVAIVFLLGVALGESLEDNGASGGSVTSVRTVLPPPSAPTVTVTVTQTSP